jgi:hypothetical protein
MSQQRLLVSAREKQSPASLISLKMDDTISAANLGKQADLRLQREGMSSVRKKDEHERTLPQSLRCLWSRTRR